VKTCRLRQMHSENPQRDDLESLILDESSDKPLKEDDTKKFYRLIKGQAGDNSEYWNRVANTENEFDAMFEHKLQALYVLLPQQASRLHAAYELLREEYVTMMTFRGAKAFKGTLFAAGYRPNEPRPSILPGVNGKEYAVALKDKNWFEGPVLAIYISAKDLSESVELNLSKAVVANLPAEIAEVMQNIP